MSQSTPHGTNQALMRTGQAIAHGQERCSSQAPKPKQEQVQLSPTSARSLSTRFCLDLLVTNPKTHSAVTHPLPADECMIWQWKDPQKIV